MYGLTRATVTLIGAGIAGLLIWIGTHPTPDTTANYWGDLGLVAAAGLVMALSQLLGGWTKWGWPRLSGSVFLLAFIPVLVVAGWILLYDQPSGNWFRDHVQSWSGDIHVRNFVEDMGKYLPVLAFGIGLVLGFSFDTTGPAEPIWRRRRVAGAGAAGPATTTGEEQQAERRVDSPEAGEPKAPPPEPAPRTEEPPPESS
jgi:hypothetical protein